MSWPCNTSQPLSKGDSSGFLTPELRLEGGREVGTVQTRFTQLSSQLRTRERWGEGLQHSCEDGERRAQRQFWSRPVQMHMHMQQGDDEPPRTLTAGTQAFWDQSSLTKLDHRQQCLTSQEQQWTHMLSKTNRSCPQKTQMTALNRQIDSKFPCYLGLGRVKKVKGSTVSHRHTPLEKHLHCPLNIC